jgi:hypothetical protein
MREDRNFKASDVSGPSIWIFILWLWSPCRYEILFIIIHSIFDGFIIPSILNPFVPYHLTHELQICSSWKYNSMQKYCKKRYQAENYLYQVCTFQHATCERKGWLNAIYANKDTGLIPIWIFMMWWQCKRSCIVIL